MRSVPSVAFQQCGVFSSEQAFEHGWTKAQLSYARRIGRVVRLRPGAYQLTDPSAELARWNHPPGIQAPDDFTLRRWAHAGTAVAGALVVPGALASHSTAAVLRGIPLIWLPTQPCVAVVPWHTGAMPRVHVHRCTDAPFSAPIGRAPCTSEERTVIDLAREHGLASGLVAADHALHNRRTTHAQLATELARCRRWPGVRAAREAIMLADRRAESPLESRSRLVIKQYGLPQPDIQTKIATPERRFVARVDFYWDEYGVVGEADGAVKYSGTDPTPLLEEKRRQARLEALGLEVVRWDNRDLRDFAATTARLRVAFARGVRSREGRRWLVLPS